MSEVEFNDLMTFPEWRDKYLPNATRDDMSLLKQDGIYQEYRRAHLGYEDSIRVSPELDKDQFWLTNKATGEKSGPFTFPESPIDYTAKYEALVDKTWKRVLKYEALVDKYCKLLEEKHTFLNDPKIIIPKEV